MKVQLTKIKCDRCNVEFYASRTVRPTVDAGVPPPSFVYCISCGTSLQAIEPERSYIPLYPDVGQESAHDVIGIGQTVLVRQGSRQLRSKEILGITILRNTPNEQPEPRFWFQGHGNVGLEDIVVREDIDPEPKVKPRAIIGQPVPEK